MKLVVKRRSLKALVAMLLYKALLDYAYLTLLTEMYDYMGLTEDMNILKIAVSYLCIVGLWIITPTGDYKVLDVFLNIQLLLMLIPMLTLYGVKNENTQYLSMVLLCHIVMCLFCMTHKEHAFVSVNKANMDFNSLLMAIAVLTAGLSIIKFGFPSLTALNIMRVYEIRAVNVPAFPLSYLVSWCAKIIIPFGFVLSLEEKKYRRAVCYLFLQGLLYLLFAHKAYLFIIMVAGVVWFVCGKKRLYEALYAIFPLGIVGSVLAYKLSGSVLALTTFVRRLLIVPAYLKFTYYEYFSSRPKVYFNNSIIGRVFALESTYEKSIPAEIGAYKGSPQTMMNTGYLGETYAEGGYFVLIVMSLLMLTICKMCSMKKDINMNIFLPVFILWFYTLNDGAVQTSLMTGGASLLLVMYAVWPERKGLRHMRETPPAGRGNIKRRNWRLI